MALLRLLCGAFLFVVSSFIPMVLASQLKYIMYLTGQHNIVPEKALVSNITHVALAFMRSEIFNNPEQNEWPLFTIISDVRSKFPKETIIQVAIGGWGNTDGFSTAAKTPESRTLFANNIKAMLDATGADGVDIDWEYPGGNGEDYKTPSNTNPTKAWEITAYPHLLSCLRTALGPSKVISAAVPGLPRDMLAFTPTTIPDIMQSVDFLNIMTYDLINRRDNITNHHTGLHASMETINTYLDAGVPPEKANLGLAFYIKWFRTAADADCTVNPIGCKTELMEDPDTGADLGNAGAFSWHDEVPFELVRSFARAMERGVYDEVGGGHYYLDEGERLFWTWDTPRAIERKMGVVMGGRGLGGVFAWGLGEDAPGFEHLKAVNDGMGRLVGGGGGGLEDTYEERSEL